MPDYYSSGRNSRRAYDERYTRSAGTRPSGARPVNASRSNGARPQGSRPQGSRPSGSRPPQGRRPAPRKRRRTQPRFYAIIAVIVIVLVVALIAILSGGKGSPDPVMPQATPTPVTNASGMSNATISSQPQTGDFNSDMANADIGATPAEQTANYSTLSEWLNDEDAEVSALNEDQMIAVNDLSVNTSLPQEWLNILLLGTDERTLSESARTDAMIICSINPKSGEVKLTSIMRDTAITINDAGEYNGTYRINAANYFGGPEYAMKKVNEYFGMNIQHYVTVNFFGFQKIAQALGGIEVDITEAEMEVINKYAVQQAKLAYYEGIDESDQINEYLTEFGPNTHLNGRQTLGYARVRSVDSDFSRAERQRTVLIKLMEKLKNKSAAEIIALVASLSDNVRTNMNMNDITEIAISVLKSGLSNVETMRLPVNGTYKEERRNEQAMFYEIDWDVNARELYNFIYA